MKAWYDDIDSATLQRIKTYSAFNDAMSKNLMVQTMYEYREKEVQDFKKTNHELAETCIARKNRIAELEKENAELKEELKAKQVVLNDFKSRVETVTDRFNKKSSQLTKAKKLLKWVVWYFREGSPNLVPYRHKVAEAEQFLKEISE